VKARTRLLKVAAEFFKYYSDIMGYYDQLEQRNKRIRVVAPTQERAEENKEDFQRANATCEQVRKIFRSHEDFFRL
jgi:hypothetical protein